MILQTQLSIANTNINITVQNTQVATAENSEQVAQQIYVNGHKMTEKEFKELFGEDNQALSLSPKMTELMKFY
ncbi:MAG: hypothetical protein ACK5Y2_13065 [Bdellovibrionales bacterium]